MKLYHGTRNLFNAFDLDKVGRHFRNAYYKGIFATPVYDHACYWAHTDQKEWAMVLSFDIDDKHILPSSTRVSDVITPGKMKNMFHNILEGFGQQQMPIHQQEDWLKKLQATDSLQISDEREHCLRQEIFGLTRPTGSPSFWGWWSDMPDNSKYRNPCVKNGDETSLVLAELGYASLHDTKENEVILYDLSKISDVRLEYASKEFLEKRQLSLGQTLIGAGNVPINRDTRPPLIETDETPISQATRPSKNKVSKSAKAHKVG